MDCDIIKEVREEMGLAIQDEEEEHNKEGGAPAIVRERDQSRNEYALERTSAPQIFSPFSLE